MKTAKRRPVAEAVLVPQRHGGALRRGGTNKGGTGRPPDAFREMCRRLGSRESTIEAVEEILDDHDHPQFMSALKWVTEYGYGKAVQPIIKDEQQEMIITIVRDEQKPYAAGYPIRDEDL